MSLSLSKLFGVGPRFSSLERMILDRVRGGLDASAAKRWDMQVQSINKIQRLSDGIEVDFYRMRNGRPLFDENLSFRNKTHELKIAEVYIRFAGIIETLVAEVWCVRGFLFSIEYSASPACFEGATGMDSQLGFSLELIMINDLDAHTS